jgi:hypothetical protein
MLSRFQIFFVEKKPEISVLEILGYTVDNIATWAANHPGFVNPCRGFLVLF